MEKFFTYLQNIFYWIAGLFVLIINKVRYFLKGYTNPRGFSIENIDKAISYDFKIVNHWLNFFQNYTKQTSLENKTILELGPGADLGIGLILLFLEAKQYNAIDVNNLIQKTPYSFYTQLFEELKSNKFLNYQFIKNFYKNSDKNKIQQKVKDLEKELNLSYKNQSKKLNYIIEQNFDLSIFKENSIDIFFSQAAFEHFDDIEKTIMQMSKIAKDNAIFIAEIDLQTHSKPLRNLDPLNIYRYPNWLYKILKFPGIPNRKRIYEYKTLLQQNGWQNIQIHPITKVDFKYLYKTKPFLYKDFRILGKEIDILNFIITATFKK